MAVHAASLSDADAKMLLDRTPHMTLTMEWMQAVQSAAADWEVYQVVTTNTSEQITDEILKSALATRRSFQLVTKRKPSAEPKVRRDHLSLTVGGLLNRAPDDLMLSPETVELVCESPDWVLQRVLQRRSRVLLRERPSIELSAALPFSLCDGSGPANLEGIFREILTLRPNTVMPEDVLLSLTGPDWDDDKLASFQLLLTHELQVPVTERVLEQAVALGFRSIHLLQFILHARPSLQIKPSVICQVAYYRDSALGPEEYGKILPEALARSKGFPLGESEMLAIIAGCWPDSLGIILSERQDVAATERVIVHLVDHRTSNWDCGANVPAFDLLLDRAGVCEAKCP
ncbi:uncharacterized protein BO95DRAFT_514619 [Aspergillus brunneoviolaceus CBS 621.78]|uniref:Uncharacterized protein n=1 Tax=Aspergillus brunneoviolaceus CBS 621.78 TaxID=1450534 RepID=A0ACD1G8Z6_9EURO|nr:hypothetical protein BO95DRAFT_514619 [Aspergillus brunneoviolaceus CBS 621.78]RAH45633.1 hypothetical protein BO95DRAFT_514619 [Aspergillus brunneoviolaceus CBS 621.78]